METILYSSHSFPDKFDDYLMSLGVPKFVVHLIKETKEMVTVTEPTNSNPNWTLVMTTGKPSLVFMIDEIYLHNTIYLKFI